MRKFLIGFVAGIVAWSGFLSLCARYIKFPPRLQTAPTYPDDDQEWLRNVTRKV